MLRPTLSACLLLSSGLALLALSPGAPEPLPAPRLECDCCLRCLCREPCPCRKTGKACGMSCVCVETGDPSPLAQRTCEDHCARDVRHAVEHPDCRRCHPRELDGRPSESCACCAACECEGDPCPCKTTGRVCGGNCTCVAP